MLPISCGNNVYFALMDNLENKIVSYNEKCLLNNMTHSLKQMIHRELSSPIPHVPIFFLLFLKWHTKCCREQTWQPWAQASYIIKVQLWTRLTFPCELESLNIFTKFYTKFAVVVYSDCRGDKKKRSPLAQSSLLFNCLFNYATSI